MNWKCRIFGHKLKPLEGGPLGDGTILDVVNVGCCEREGTIHKLDPGKKAHWIRGGRPGAAYRIDRKLGRFSIGDPPKEDD